MLSGAGTRGLLGCLLLLQHRAAWLLRLVTPRTLIHATMQLSTPLVSHLSGRGSSWCSCQEPCRDAQVQRLQRELQAAQTQLEGAKQQQLQAGHQAADVERLQQQVQQLQAQLAQEQQQQLQAGHQAADVERLQQQVQQLQAQLAQEQQQHQQQLQAAQARMASMEQQAAQAPAGAVWREEIGSVPHADFSPWECACWAMLLAQVVTGC